MVKFIIGQIRNGEYMSTPFQSAADEMKRIMQEKVEEIKSNPAMGEILKILQALNSMEDLMNEPRTSLSQVFDLQLETEPAQHTIRFDEFVGLTPLEAAKKYLKKMKEARPFPEIVEAINSGGGRVGSEDELKTSLSRSTLEVVKIGDRYGLLEHYPQIKRGKKKRGRPPQNDEGGQGANDKTTTVEDDDNGDHSNEPQETE